MLHKGLFDKILCRFISYLDAVGPLLPPVDSFGGPCPSVMVIYAVNSSRRSVPAAPHASMATAAGYNAAAGRQAEAGASRLRPPVALTCGVPALALRGLSPPPGFVAASPP